MGQVDSSGETGRPSRDLDFRFLLCQEYYSTLAQDFILAWLDHWRWTGVVCEALEVEPLVWVGKTVGRRGELGESLLLGLWSEFDFDYKIMGTIKAYLSN